MTTTLDSLRTRLEEAGQGHLLRHWDDLDDAGRERLRGELEALDLAEVRRLAELQRRGGEAEAEHRLEPPELFPLERTPDEERRADEARRRGAELLADGRVGYVLVAGGQASRLGYDGPKGAYPIGPVTDRTLFEWHAHRLRAAARRHGCRTPWYVMTSPQNDAATKAFFQAHEHLGLDPEDVTFFTQDVLPALDDEGRVLLAAPDRVFLAPNGHGGVLLALARSGALDDMRRRGVQRISYFQVDNPLARPADPLFLGLHALAEAGMSTKVVPKRDAGEKVGVIGRIDGRMGCIEYSDLPDELRHATDEDGKLAFRAGNIAVHVLDVAFVESLTDGGLRLPWHLARKRMRVLGEDGRETERWGTKFETFVFDALSDSERSVTLEVDRALEFSPVKNAEGADSPETCRADLRRLFAGWAAAAGRPLPPAGPDGVPPVEVGPLVAETEEEFRERADAEPREHERGHVYG